MFQLKNYTKQFSCALHFYLIYLGGGCSVTKSSLMRPHELQHNRLPYPSLSSRVCSNSCPLCQWCHRTISFSVIPFSSCSQFFPASGSFPESGLCIRWPKFWNFSISPSNEYLGLITYWLVWSSCFSRNSQQSSPAPQFESINSLALSFFMVQLSHLYMTTGKGPLLAKWCLCFLIHCLGFL